MAKGIVPASTKMCSGARSRYATMLYGVFPSEWQPRRSITNLPAVWTDKNES